MNSEIALHKVSQYKINMIKATIPTLFRRKKVCENMDKIAKEGKMKFTDKEFIKLKNYGRK